jgi:hypothetical protein
MLRPSPQPSLDYPIIKITLHKNKLTLNFLSIQLPRQCSPLCWSTSSLRNRKSRSVVFNLFSPRTPRDTFPLNFVPPKLLVPNSSYT